MTKEKDISINVYGYLNEFSGLSESARSNIDALLENNLKVNVHSFNYDHSTNTYRDFPNPSNNDASINLFHININFIEKFIQDIGTQPFKEKYNIAYWAWEFSEPPIEIEQYISLFDEIWVPSDFCVNAFNKIASIPVVKIPHALATPTLLKSNELEELQAHISDKFVFLTIFDSVSSIDRKNPFATINAFISSFENNNDVVLIIKTHNLDQFSDAKKMFLDIANKHTNIILINKKISKDELQNLIQNANCYVSLHRSEGFGLTMAEAMSYGKLVIATGYSGNLEYMNINNSILVPYELIASEKDYGLTKKGYIYANPDINFVSKKLLQIVTNYNQYSGLAQRGEELIRNKYSFSTIGQLMKERLVLISKNLKTSKDTEYFNLSEEILNINLENQTLERKIKKLEKNIFIKIKYWYKKKIKC
ncbi:hypothetical protein AXE80_11280 [Wenyingzhuangia fucanilytica]|uniref:Glycosyl transferase family 1 domain-containing protein n=1 Tax=Wenyingzhuangia fucanilytica TaxID=1790137 RepID=A0A1B1Y7U1_9FLAO|nr:glycosyltransferase [Wenyingzhuangia fucanilytica]ANW96826.1 hypothetical protein AXE80_11280 [Wenyingzhuangia fucanilytica]